MRYDPEWVKERLRFRAAGHNAQLEALEAEGLLTLNNGPEWIGTGGIGYTDELPGNGFDPGHVRLQDIWGGGLQGPGSGGHFARHVQGVLLSSDEAD